MTGRWGDTPWLFPNNQGRLYEERHLRRIFIASYTGRICQDFACTISAIRMPACSCRPVLPLLYVSQQLGHTNRPRPCDYYARWIPTGDQRYVDGLDTAREKVGTKRWHQKRWTSEAIDFRTAPSPPTHDDESTTTHPR